MSALDKINAQVNQAAEQVDMNKPSEGGGSYTPPANGKARARFVGYFEYGKHAEKDFNNPNATKLRDKVRLVFELSGPNHPANENGEPIRISIDETYTPGKAPNEKSNFYKLFMKMNYAGKARHIAQLLGEAFIVTVYHKKSQDGKRTFATLKGSDKTLPVGGGYDISGPNVQDPISGKTITVPVDPAKTELRAFLWDLSDKADFDALFIDGKYDEVKDESGKVVREARSKNVLQELIMSASNWPALRDRLGLSDGDLAVQAERPVKDEVADDDIPF